jgi:hypothetical protein
MRSTVLFAVVLVLNIGSGDGPRALAGTAAPQSTVPQSATQEVPLPDLKGFPTAAAPDELASVPLPDTISAVTALFERLPAEVAGHTRSPQLDPITPERATVGYGEGPSSGGGVRNSLLWLQAMDLTKSDFFPTNWTGGHVVAFMAGRGKEMKDDRDGKLYWMREEAGRDGNLFWMRQVTFVDAAGSAERFPVYGTLWGRVDSPWMFSIQADARENRDALLAAFVIAARSSPR